MGREEKMTIPDKMERCWTLDAGTVQASTFIRLLLPSGSIYADIVRMATTLFCSRR